MFGNKAIVREAQVKTEWNFSKVWVGMRKMFWVAVFTAECGIKAKKRDL